jgi:hypothetical protein
MKLNLEADYRIKEGEEGHFADSFEVDGANLKIAAALEQLSPEDRKTARAAVVARKATDEYFDPLRAQFGPRVSAFLLRMAMAIKYKERIPRTEGARTPGKWWGRILDELDDRPPALELTAAQALWLTEVWFDDAVQNGFEPKYQRWLNAFEENMAALRDEVNPPEAPKA